MAGECRFDETAIIDPDISQTLFLFIQILQMLALVIATKTETHTEQNGKNDNLYNQSVHALVRL